MDIKLEENMSHKMLCNACLCVGLKLKEIVDQKQIIYYLNALAEIPLMSISINSLHLCFDCHAQLKRAMSFREQMKDSYRILQAYTNEVLNEYLLTDVSRPQRLKVVHNDSITIAPEYFEVEASEVMVKEEVKIEWADERDYSDICEDQRSERDALSDNDTLSDGKIKKTDRDRKIKKKKKKRKDELKKCKSKNKIIKIDLSYEDMVLERENEMKKENYANAEYKCENCILGFKYQPSYKIHMDTKHSKDIGDHICPICKTVWSTASSLATHQKRHSRRYECSVCHKRTIDLKVMKHHWETKHEGSVKEYKCNICGKISNSIDTHRYHKDTHKARLQCTECDKTFRHRAALMNHKIAVHEFNNEFPCTVCDKVFRWKNSLKRHLSDKHEGKSKCELSMPHCDLCDIHFSSIFSYNRHMNNSLKHVSPDQLRYICDHCNRRFADKTKLRDHIEEKHLNKTYQCHLCLKPSKNRVGLDQHIRNVHKGRRIDKICHHCGKGFPTKLQLESHIITHTGERPFICEFCPTTFSQQSNLYKHNKQVHLNMKSKRYPMNKKRKQDQTEALNVPNISDFNLHFNLNNERNFVL